MTTKNNNSQLYYKESVGFNKVKENSTSQRNLKLLLQHQINDKNDKNVNNTNIDNNYNIDSDHHSGDNNTIILIIVIMRIMSRYRLHLLE